MAGSECVRVIVRCRPLNQREIHLNSQAVVEINQTTLQCTLLAEQADGSPKTFTFDGVYNQGSTTEQIYTDFVYSLVEGAIEGYNATVFAYGQTGSGKSFTMQGPGGPGADTSAQTGVLPRAIEHLFESIAASTGVKYLVSASYLEIYNEEIRDLLSQDTKRKLDLREEAGLRGVYVENLSKHVVNSVDDCNILMELGWKNRASGSTLMNADSSRSHSIFTVSVERMEVTGQSDQNAQLVRCGKLNLVDLAGSERQSKTGAKGDQLKEASKINLSLSALANVISALVDGKSKHIPYRDSKLTRLLQDSLGGNTKTLMITCVSPSSDNYDETLSTLRYANRAKNIQNRPTINQDPKDAMLVEYQREIQRLRQLVQSQPHSPMEEGAEVDTDERLERERQALRAEYEEKIQQLHFEIEKEQQTNAKAAVELENLRRSYQDELEKINRPAPATAVGQQRTRTGRQTDNHNDLRAKLKEIEAHLVGGERVDDKAFLERRWKKKSVAEKRATVLALLLAKTRDEDGALLRVYDDIQQEIQDKSDIIKKYKAKLKSLDQDIRDLQGEFEDERSEYLASIRRQDQQLRLLQQVLAQVQKIVRKDCNYSDLDAVVQNCVWNDDRQCWELPEMIVYRTRLPPTDQQRSTDLSTQFHNQNETPMELGEESGIGGDRLLQKLERGEAEDLAGRYFRSIRPNQILNRTHHDLHRALQRAKQKNPGAPNVNDHGNSSAPWSAPYTYNLGGGWTAVSGGLTAGPVRKPKRLESLASSNALPPPSVDANRKSIENESEQQQR